mmetsp:Transcript_66984/g.195841  ORF Transcript_66984/g.195841 Transcript_66984/m.195841 type:complete len:344 (+) Transcript_66984:60-1091(+)
MLGLFHRDPNSVRLEAEEHVSPARVLRRGSPKARRTIRRLTHFEHPSHILHFARGPEGRNLVIVRAGKLGVETPLLPPLRVVVGVVVSVAVVAQQRDNSEALLSGFHGLVDQLDAPIHVGARRSSRLLHVVPEQVVEEEHGRDTRLVRDLDHPVDGGRHEARLDARSADALNLRADTSRQGQRPITRQVGLVEGGVFWVHAADTRVVRGERAVPAEGRGGAARAEAADEPGRRRNPRVAQLGEDPLGEVVVPTEVDRHRSVAELVHVVRRAQPLLSVCLARNLRRCLVHGRRIRHFHAHATEPLDLLNLVGGGARGDHGGERQAEQPGEVRLGDGRAARARLH